MQNDASPLDKQLWQDRGPFKIFLASGEIMRA